eukprot:sb/3463749/
MRLLSFLLALALAKGAQSQGEPDFAHCLPLVTPRGVHPGTGDEIDAGYYNVTHEGSTLVAATVCDESQGWTLTSALLEDLRCEYDDFSHSYWWSHQHKNSPSPPQVWCAHSSPKPLVQRYHLGSEVSICKSTVERLEFEIEMRESAEALLPCIADNECRVTDVQCRVESDGDSILEVTLKSTTLGHVDMQRDLLSNALDVIRHLRVLVEEGHSRRKRSAAERQKRQFDDMGDGETTGGDGCDTGQVETSSGSCTSCTKGTFANTTAEECQSCDYDTFGNETELASCYNCTGSLGTLDVGSTNESSCIAICMVPTVQLTTSIDPESRATDGGDVTINCDTDYTYGGLSTATIECNTNETNNNFPASCRKISIAVESSDYDAIESGTNAILTCQNEASDTPSSIMWYYAGSSLSNSSDYTISAGSTTTSGDEMFYGSTLTITSFASGDEGSYSCMADYSDPIDDETSTDLSLTVIGKLLICTTLGHVDMQRDLLNNALDVIRHLRVLVEEVRNLIELWGILNCGVGVVFGLFRGL